VPAPVGLMGKLDLDSRLRGNDTLGLARLEKGRLLHSAKMLQKKKAERLPPSGGRLSNDC